MSKGGYQPKVGREPSGTPPETGSAVQPPAGLVLISEATLQWWIDEVQEAHDAIKFDQADGSLRDLELLLKNMRGRL